MLRLRIPSTSLKSLSSLRREDDSVERGSGIRVQSEGASEDEIRLDLPSLLRESRVFARLGASVDVQIMCRFIGQCDLSEQFSSSQNGYSMIENDGAVYLRNMTRIHTHTHTCTNTNGVGRSLT